MPVTGREEALLTRIAQARAPDLRVYYRLGAPPVDLTAQALEVFLEPAIDPAHPGAKKGARTPLMSVLQSLTWTEEGTPMIMTGSLTATLPENDPASLPVRRGSRISLVANANGVRIPLWTMRARSPQYDPISQTVTAELVDQMDALGRVIKRWAFKKDKRHPNGWTADRITRAVCHEMGVTVGKIPVATAKIKRLAPAEVASAMDILILAWGKERTATGRSYDIIFDRGHLTVVPAFRRNPVLYSLKDRLTAATAASEAPEDQGENPRDRPATRLVAHGYTLSGGKHHNLTYTAARPDLYGLLGRVTVAKKYGKVGSLKTLQSRAKRDLAKYLKVTQTAQITHPGIPFLHKGDAIQLTLPKYGYSGKDAFIFIRSVTHSLQGANYTTDLDLVQVDYSAAVLRQVVAAEARIAKRKARAARKAAAA